jgi:hypothetical protein
MNPAQLINQSSGNTEYYTPAPIIEAARATMGGIDLDPASSAIANQTVQAAHYFDATYDALRRNVVWTGNVWMNHPFGRGEQPCNRRCKKKTCRHRGYHITSELPGNDAWINKLIHHYQTGDIKQACCITFASTSEAWFAPLFAYPMCFLQPRTNYHLPCGAQARGVTKGSVVTYLGPNLTRFAHHFTPLGAILIPYDSPHLGRIDTDFGLRVGRNQKT